MQRICFFLIVISMIVPIPVLACLWDSQTRFVEKSQFPIVNDLITGNFARHSSPYYEWRIQDRLAIREEDRIPEDYNDIAVAYDKLGQQDKAINFIRDKIERWPEENRYESEANLGTFYIHSGEYEKGLSHIEKAIEINPEAHFGREIYQKLLVEYVVQQQKAGFTLPLEIETAGREKGFAAFVLSARNIPTKYHLKQREIEIAIKGISGMMRFGHHDSPVLLEALGDLMLCRKQNWMRERATEAYLKASYEAEDPESKKLYRQKAKKSVPKNMDWTLEDMEKGFKERIAKGDELYADIIQYEENWINSGKDVEQEFQTKYLPVNNRTPANTQQNHQLTVAARQAKMVLSVIVFLNLCGLAFLTGFYLSRRKRKS